MLFIVKIHNQIVLLSSIVVTEVPQVTELFIFILGCAIHVSARSLNTKTNQQQQIQVLT